MRVRRKGYSKPLRDVAQRLEMLGYTVAGARTVYEGLVRSTHASERPPLTFRQLADALATVDVTSTSPLYAGDYDFGEFVKDEILERLSIESRFSTPGRLWSAGQMLENWDPWAVLRLLAENPRNLNLPVNWYVAGVADQFPLVAKSLGRRVGPDHQFLLVTEGSSDSHILKRALSLLRPAIADFFTFVDMEDDYPFAGTGNLYRFCQGLVRIGIQNRIVVIYDNDAEGSAKHAQTRALQLPPTMRVMQLPVLEDFRVFHTVGPNGESTDDINGRAVAIECFLDLAVPGKPPPRVRWTSFNRSLGHYQGELEHKESYTRRFLRLRERTSSYDLRKLETLLDAVVSECVAIAELSPAPGH